MPHRRLPRRPRIGFLTDLPSRSVLEDGSELRENYVSQATSYCGRQRDYLKNSYDQIEAIITDG